MQETQLQQKEILAEKKENISKKSMHKKIRLISFISILGIFLLIVTRATIIFPVSVCIVVVLKE